MQEHNRKGDLFLISQEKNENELLALILAYFGERNRDQGKVTQFFSDLLEHKILFSLFSLEILQLKESKTKHFKKSIILFQLEKKEIEKYALFSLSQTEERRKIKKFFNTMSTEQPDLLLQLITLNVITFLYVVIVCISHLHLDTLIVSLHIYASKNMGKPLSEMYQLIYPESAGHNP